MTIIQNKVAFIQSIAFTAELKQIPSRMEMEGMDVDLCEEVLDSLSDRTREKGALVEVPRFSNISKAHVDRDQHHDHDEWVFAILFEGWTVYVPLMIDAPDFLLSTDMNSSSSSVSYLERYVVSSKCGALDLIWTHPSRYLLTTYSGVSRTMYPPNFAYTPPQISA